MSDPDKSVSDNKPAVGAKKSPFGVTENIKNALDRYAKAKAQQRNRALNATRRSESDSEGEAAQDKDPTQQQLPQEKQQQQQKRPFDIPEALLNERIDQLVAKAKAEKCSDTLVSGDDIVVEGLKKLEAATTVDEANAALDAVESRARIIINDNYCVGDVDSLTIISVILNDKVKVGFPESTANDAIRLLAGQVAHQQLLNNMVRPELTFANAVATKTALPDFFKGVAGINDIVRKDDNIIIASSDMFWGDVKLNDNTIVITESQIPFRDPVTLIKCAGFATQIYGRAQQVVFVTSASKTVALFARFAEKFVPDKDRKVVVHRIGGERQPVGDKEKFDFVHEEEEKSCEYFVQFDNNNTTTKTKMMSFEGTSPSVVKGIATRRVTATDAQMGQASAVGALIMPIEHLLTAEHSSVSAIVRLNMKPAKGQPKLNRLVALDVASSIQKLGYSTHVLPSNDVRIVKATDAKKFKPGRTRLSKEDVVKIKAIQANLPTGPIKIVKEVYSDIPIFETRIRMDGGGAKAIKSAEKAGVEKGMAAIEITALYNEGQMTGMPRMVVDFENIVKEKLLPQLLAAGKTTATAATTASSGASSVNNDTSNYKKNEKGEITLTRIEKDEDGASAPAAAASTTPAAPAANAEDNGDVKNKNISNIKITKVGATVVVVMEEAALANVQAGLRRGKAWDLLVLRGAEAKL